MRFPNISVDVVRLKLIPFALKDVAERLMNDLAANFFFAWDGFVKLSLRE